MRSFLLLILFVLLPGCSGYPRAVAPDPAAAHESYAPLYIVNHGWHTGIILSANLVRPFLPSLEQRLGAARFYEFGWGDRDFYQADTVNSGMAFKAILWPSDAVVYAAPLEQTPPRRYPRDRLFRLERSEAQLQSLISFLQRSFTYAASGQVIPTGHRSPMGGQFFRGEGRYNLFNTCNTWTAKALKSAGYPIEAESVITAGALMQLLNAGRAHE